MYSYFFRFADLNIQFNTEFPFENFYEMNIFQIDFHGNEDTDIIYTLKILPDNWKICGTMIHESRKSRIYIYENTVYRYFFWSIFSDEKYILLSYLCDNPCVLNLFIQREDIEKLLTEFHLAGLMSMEQALLKFQAFQLHSSVIEWNGKGILFSAPSGTGKSTQAELWKKYKKANIVNGDKAIIRKKENTYWVYGSPYAGTSKIYTTYSVPIQAIIVLEQDLNNHIEKLEKANAFKEIYKESTVNAWNPVFVNCFSDLLLDLITKVPVYKLRCLPNREAVELVEDTLFC